MTPSCGIVRLVRYRKGLWRLQLNGDTDHLGPELGGGGH